MPTNPELILYAIQSAIKLGKQIRRAYLDNLKRRELILPLPKFPSQKDWTSALNFFEGDGNVYVQKDPRIADLLVKAQAQTLIEDEKHEFTIHY